VILTETTSPDVKGRRGSGNTNLLSRDYLTVRPIEQWLMRVATRYARGRLLDVGCGSKPYEPLFRSVTENYVGADLTQNRENSVDVIISPVGPLPFLDGSFETVLSTQVLEHVPEPAAYLAELARVLTPGGHLLLTSPVSYMHHEEPYDYFRFTRHGVRYLLEKAGLTLIRIDTGGGAWRLLGQVLINHKAHGRRWRIPVGSGIVYYTLLLGGNIVFSLLDNFNTNRSDPANTMAIARKPERTS
jgi:SAM-dependent methyltransferase